MSKQSHPKSKPTAGSYPSFGRAAKSLVEAPDAEAAIKKAKERFEVTEPWRQRSLLAKRYA